MTNPAVPPLDHQQVSRAPIEILLATATGAGDAYGPGSLSTTSYQAFVDGTGAVTATVVIEVSHDGKHWMTLGTITLSGSGTATDGFASDGVWAHRRANLTAISGTGATVRVLSGGA